ncbi:hypothetical protein GYMLUDRAFT_39888 [Collybiopsis luxurians FD-317 M1]|nr:hypothetical protein GYMLUDRAFT_39888 [Collybiopsis luxurians FD-317 M1]
MYAMLFPSILLLTCFLFLAFTNYLLTNRPPTSTRSRTHSSPEAIVALLSRTGAQSTSGSRKIASLLESRALANERLRRAFGLTNTFVSANVGVHTSFVRQMTTLISRHGRNPSDYQQWADFLHVARQAVASHLFPESESQSCSLSGSFAEFIQLVTLKVVIAGLLNPDGDMATIDAEDLRVSAALITKLWAMSKLPSHPTNSPLSSELNLLNHHLRRLLPDTEKYPNPIDFVIPTWETLWRLVATCLAHVYNNEAYHRVFEELLEDPASRRYNGIHSDSKGSSELCASWIITETLRLHPPSRHISRTFQADPSFVIRFLAKVLPESFADWLNLPQITEIADIEHVHLCAHIWGPDALTFDPGRWAATSCFESGMTKESGAGKPDTVTFFAFGHGPLSCVGKKWAPMASAIIIAAILEGIKVKGLEIIGTSNIGGRAGWDGWKIQRARIYACYA